jgi:S-adenosylmethionine:tRNA ribosyltransferase-isomerase
VREIPLVNIADYDYILDQSRIAKFPLPKRDQSKLLVYKNGIISHGLFAELPVLLSPDSLMILNNTKVVQARMNFTKASGANIEIFILEPINPTDYTQSFSSTRGCVWKCIVGNLKRWKGEILEMSIGSTKSMLKAKRVRDLLEGVVVEFSWDNSGMNFAEVIELCGKVPIPPYLNRSSEESDRHNYQTVYAKPEGSVAAPTAGLHFTREVLSKIGNQGIESDQVTLHVGAGTFKPVKSNTIFDHEMHTEHFFVNTNLISKIIKFQGKIVSVGTTTLRTLESLYWLGVKLHLGLLDVNNPFVGQWEAYQLTKSISLTQSLDSLQKWLKSQKIAHIEATTQLCIVPGYHFKVVDTLITNYHQPRSTLLLLVAAFIGKDWKRVYDYALENDFRFLSYGDSSILYKNDSLA